MRPEPKTLISPHFSAEKLDAPTTDDLVDVLEDRVKHWILEPAKKLMKDPIEQVVGFGVSLLYFEGIWNYIKGRDSHRESQLFFKEAFVDVFRPSKLKEPLLGNIAKVLYEDARCGFFHDGMFRHRIYFGKVGGPLAVTLPKINGVIDEEGEIQSIVVDPEEYVQYLEGHFGKLIKRLHDFSEAELRGRFEKFCRAKWDIGGTPRVVAL